MFARVLFKSSIPAVLRRPVTKAFRPFSHQAAPSGTAAIPSHEDVEVVIVTPAMTESSLEWILDSPPNFHEFAEPPIVVEIEHLKNLVIPEQH